MHYRLRKLTREVAVPLSTALRHLSTALVPSCRMRCEHVEVFHKSVTPFRMQWQVSNFLHKHSHLHILFSPFRYLFPIYFIRLSCHASPPLFLPPLHAKKAQLNNAQNTPLEDNLTTNRWATNYYNRTLWSAKPVSFSRRTLHHGASK